MCVKLRQHNVDEIGDTPSPALMRFVVVIGASKWFNSLIVGDSWVTVGDSLTVHLFIN